MNSVPAIKAVNNTLACAGTTLPTQQPKLLYVGSTADKSYFTFLRTLLKGYDCKVFLGEVNTLMEIKMFCDKQGITKVITSNQSFVLKLSGKRKASLDNYAGSVFTLGENIKVVCINPLEHFVTIAYGPHLAERYISKLLKPEGWIEQTALSWEVATPATLPAIYERFKADALWIAVDIETKREALRIAVSGYCAIFKDGTTHSIVIPIEDEFMLLWAKKFNELPQGKIMQNGSYDNAYFLRWGIPPINYLWDTLHLFHCWYAEMPKSLDFLTSYLLPSFQYWKDESETGNLHEYYFYNAKDTWATANCFLALMREMPAWAKKNYLIEFPLVFACLHCSMEGIQIDESKREEISARETLKLESSLASLRNSMGIPAFNPGSPKQVKQVLDILGNKDIPTSGVKDMRKAASRHPLNAWYIERIIKYREAKKLLSSYLSTELLGGRFLYSINPAGTDTGRLASRESAFWCGSNMQNIPPEVKGMFMADDGWLLAEIDKSQSEDRCVAFLSGEPALLDIFADRSKDSHTIKTCMFFGCSEEEVRAQEKLKKAGEFEGFTLRDLGKRVNHGSNYNMGANVLLETMGVEAVAKAKLLLGLHQSFDLKRVCEYLLDKYNKAFPAVKGRWYNAIKKEIALTKKLTGFTGWTRYCFNDPLKSKQALNAYVAHVPQSLSVMIVNKEFMDVWRFALENPSVIRIKAQIHDSILFQYKVGEDWVVEKVESMMQSSVKIKGSDGVMREFSIPTDTKSGLKSWGK